MSFHLKFLFALFLALTFVKADSPNENGENPLRETVDAGSVDETYNGDDEETYNEDDEENDDDDQDVVVVHDKEKEHKDNDDEEDDEHSKDDRNCDDYDDDTEKDDKVNSVSTESNDSEWKFKAKPRTLPPPKRKKFC